MVSVRRLGSIGEVSGSCLEGIGESLGLCRVGVGKSFVS